MVKGSSYIMSENTPSSTAYGLLAILSMMIFGSAFWAIVIALDGIPPITLGFLRAFIAFIFMILLFLILKYFRNEKIWLTGKRFWLAGMSDRRYLFLIMGCAFFGTTLPNMLQNVGMLMMDEGSTSSLASLIQGAGPIFTIMLAAIILHERLGPWKITGLVIAIPSTIVLTTYGSGGFDIGSEEALGGFLNLLTALSYSFSGLFLKSSFNRGANPVSLLTMNAFYGTLFTLPFLIILWIIGLEDPTMIVRIDLAELLSLIYISICVYAIAAIIWYKVMKRSELSKVTFFVFLLPIFSTAMGYLLLDERLTAVQIAAALVLIVGVFISQRTIRRSKADILAPPRR